jgi:outer membrane protein OmpA-like peptidoglycan-associated protein
MKTFCRIAVLPFVSLFVGCASAPPPELADARSKVDQVDRSAAAALDPVDVQLAKDSLQRAERAYLDEGDSTVARGLAYVASREADLAMTRAATTLAQARVDESQRQIAENPNLARAVDLEDVARQGQDLMTLFNAVGPRPPRDHEAELRMKDALGRLSTVASVRDEPRGMVVTMPGDDLFECGCTLLTDGRAHLIRLAEALQVDRSARVRIESHTDLAGTELQQRMLSSARAVTVANYLVSRGVAADRLLPIGRGASQALGDNGTDEGRAKNRRVEIIVETSSSLALR